MHVFDLFITTSAGMFSSNLLCFYFGCLIFVVSLLQTLCRVRIETIGQMTALPRLAHARMIGLFVCLQLMEFILIPSVILLLPQDLGPVGIMTQYFILLCASQVNLWALVALYHCEARARQMGDAWEEKSLYVFYIEFARDIFMLLVYPICVVFSLFYVPQTGIIFVPFGTIRQFIMLAYSVYKNATKYMRFSAATRDMDSKYPPLSKEEIDQLRDKTCIICREEFDAETQNQADTPRKLPCHHVFHFRCLHSWLERQQNCPTCRRDVFRAPPQAEQPQERVARIRSQGSPAELDDANDSATLSSLLARFTQPAEGAASSSHDTPAPPPAALVPPPADLEGVVGVAVVVVAAVVGIVADLPPQPDDARVGVLRRHAGLGVGVVDRGAAHRSDDGLVEVGNAEDEAMRLLQARTTGADIESGHRADVGAGAERPSCAAQHHAAHIGIALEFEGQIADAILHLAVQRIERIRPVEDDARDGACAFEANGHTPAPWTLKMWLAMVFFCVCVVPPVMVSMRTSRTMRSSGSAPK